MEEAYEKRFVPLQELVSESNVVDETVTEPPRETPVPLIVMEELVSPVLSRVPEIVGVRVRAPAVGTTRIPRVCPLVVWVVVEKVTADWVVVEYPEPKAVSLASRVVWSGMT